jgi:hypothetical protein
MGSDHATHLYPNLRLDLTGKGGWNGRPYHQCLFRRLGFDGYLQRVEYVYGRYVEKKMP